MRVPQLTTIRHAAKIAHGVSFTKAKEPVRWVPVHSSANFMQDSEIEYRIVSHFPSETDEDHGSPIAIFLKRNEQIRAYVLEQWANAVGCRSEFSIEWFDSVLYSYDLESEEGREGIASLFSSMEYLDGGPLRTALFGSFPVDRVSLRYFSQNEFVIECGKEEFDSLIDDIYRFSFISTESP